MPSTTFKGSDSSMLRSMKAPGSPSSALQTRYRVPLAESAPMAHFFPVGNPPPPRPRSFDLLICSMTQRGSPFSKNGGQRLKTAIVEIFFHAGGVDNAVVPHGHAALAVEKRHVAVKLHELCGPRSCPARLRLLHNPAAHYMFIDDRGRRRPRYGCDKGPCRAERGYARICQDARSPQAPKQLA